MPSPIYRDTFESFSGNYISIVDTVLSFTQNNLFKIVDTGLNKINTAL